MLDAAGIVATVLAEIITAVDRAIEDWVTAKLSAVGAVIVGKLDVLHDQLASTNVRLDVIEATNAADAAVIGGKLDALTGTIDQVRSGQLTQTEALMDLEQELANLQAQVEADTAVDTSAIALLTQLGDLMRAAADDPAQVRALADTVQANSAALAAAVSANTPAAPPVP